MLSSTINYGNVVAGSTALPGGVNATYFYARWTGYLIPSVSGVHTIGVNSQDGCSLYVSGQALIENLTAVQSANGTTSYTQSTTINLTANVPYELVIEWQHGSGANYECQLLWTPPSGSIAIISSGNLSTSPTSITGNLSGSFWNGTLLLWYPTGAGALPYGFAGAWSSSVGYIAGDEVTYGGSYWKFLVANTNSAPITGNTNWQLVGTGGNQFMGAYNAGTAYVVGNQVTYGTPAGFYVCIANTTGNLPTNATYWQLLSTQSTNVFDGPYASGTAYSIGNQVTYQGSYWICISPTTGNTPSTTSSYWTLVGTSAILLGAYAGGTSYVAGNQVTYSGNVYTCILASTGNLPTNTTYWTIIGPSTLDSIADGSTYGRPLASRLSSGKPLIDFSEAIHLNKTIDNIADGASYVRTTANEKAGAARGFAIINSSNLVTATAFAGSNNSVDTTTNVGGPTTATSYTTVGSFAVTLQGNVNSLLGQITLTESVAPQTTFGPNTAGTGSGTGWTNPSYVTSAVSFATETIPQYTESNPLIGTSFGFSIPAGLTIAGIVVTYVGKCGGSPGAIVTHAQLYHSGNLGTAKTPNVTLTSMATQYTMGNSSDMWGLNTSTLTPAIVNSSTFGFWISITGEAVSGNLVSIDDYQVTIYTNAGTFTAKARIRIGSNNGTEVDLSGAGPSSGTSTITMPASGAQTVIVEAAVTSSNGGTVDAEFALVTSTPLSSSMLT